MPDFHTVYTLLCASTLNRLLSSVLNPPVEWWWWFTCLPRVIGRLGRCTRITGPSHVLPHPSLAHQTRFILFPFQSAEHQMRVGMVASYLSLHPFQPFSLCWGWSVGIGEAMRQDMQNDRARGWVGTRWEIHPKKPQGLPVHPLQEREEIFLLLLLRDQYGMRMDFQRLEGVVPRLWEWEMPGLLGHVRVPEMTAGPWEACHLLTLVAARPESHSTFQNRNEELPFEGWLCGIWGPDCFHPTSFSCRFQIWLSELCAGIGIT